MLIKRLYIRPTSYQRPEDKIREDHWIGNFPDQCLLDDYALAQHLKYNRNPDDTKVTPIALNNSDVVELKPSSIDGTGVFASRKIKASEPLLLVTGAFFKYVLSFFFFVSHTLHVLSPLLCLFFIHSSLMSGAFELSTELHAQDNHSFQVPGRVVDDTLYNGGAILERVLTPFTRDNEDRRTEIHYCNHSCNPNAHILMIKIDTDEPKIIKNKSSTKKNARERDAIAMNIRTLSQEICPWMSKHYALRSCWRTFFFLFSRVYYILCFVIHLFISYTIYYIYIYIISFPFLFCQSFAGSFCVPLLRYKSYLGKFDGRYEWPRNYRPILNYSNNIQPHKGKYLYVLCAKDDQQISPMEEVTITYCKGRGRYMHDSPPTASSNDLYGMLCNCPHKNGDGMCKDGCGFHGSLELQGYCSVCARRHYIKANNGDGDSDHDDDDAEHDDDEHDDDDEHERHYMVGGFSIDFFNRTENILPALHREFVSDTSDGRTVERDECVLCEKRWLLAMVFAMFLISFSVILSLCPKQRCEECFLFTSFCFLKSYNGSLW